MNVTEELQKLSNVFGETTSPEVQATTKNALNGIASLNLFAQMKKTGDIFPHFIIPNHLGEFVYSEKLLKEGPLVVTFYRGSWCPFCNILLRGYQAILPELHAKGASLVAISPEVPDESMGLVGKLNINFHILSDRYSRYAKQLGIAFKVEPEFEEMHKELGLDIRTSQNIPSGNLELPVPVTYIIRPNGVIAHHFAEIDYTKRLDPRDVLKLI